MTRRMIKFPVDVINENTALKIQVRMLAVMVSLLFSKLISKKKQFEYVLFMTRANVTLIQAGTSQEKYEAIN